MVTHSFEFVLGMFFLAMSAFYFLARFLLDHTRFGRTVKQHEQDLDSSHPIFGCHSLSDTALAMGVIWLLAGSALTIAAFFAYAGL